MSHIILYCGIYYKIQNIFGFEFANKCNEIHIQFSYRYKISNVPNKIHCNKI